MPEVRLIDANALIDKLDVLISDAILNDTVIHYALIRQLVAEHPTIESDIDRAAILRLCNEIEDLAADIGNHTMMDVVYAEAQMIFYKAEEIGKELTRDAGTD